jgi:Major Facilitator Superfamily
VLPHTIAGFAPAEQAWLAEGVAPADRPRLYGLNEGLGFAGMGIGAIAAASPSFVGRWLPGPDAYEPLLIGVFIAFLGSLLVLVPAPEQSVGGGATTRDTRRGAQPSGVSVLWRLVLANAFNGFGLGLAEPLIAYWFFLRYGVGPAYIAPVLAGMYFATGVSSVGGGWLAERVGLIRTVVAARLAGLALLVGLPLMPSYGAAAMAYLLRAVFNRGTLGLRQSLVVGLVAPERRGLAVSVNAVSNQLTQTPGPYVAASFFGEGALALPFYLAALFQGTYLVLYARLFRAYEPPRRTSAGAHASRD